ncbi:MAG: ChbG/HpnK family deacetylase, partial [Thermoanaerobaculia bacterium]
MKKLIVTADDVGLHRGMTTGAIRGHLEGIVTACSIVANGRAFDDAVARLRDVPTLEVGVHLALVEEDPLTEGIRFPEKWPRFIPAYLAGLIPRKAIERELRAQVEKVVASGLRVTHLNGHQHLHVLPGLFAMVLELGRTYGIPYIRTIDDRGGRAAIPRRCAVGALSILGRR